VSRRSTFYAQGASKARPVGGVERGGPLGQEKSKEKLPMEVRW